MGLRFKYHEPILFPTPGAPRALDWLEVITENLIPHPLSGSSPEMELAVERARKDYSVVFHGVSLSIGSMDPLGVDYLKRLKAAIERFEPAWISDHLCWTGVGGHNLHDLLPLPYTEEAIAHVSERISRVQDFLGRRILIENVSSYAEASFSEMSEAQFLAEVSSRSDCGILLDVNNIAVSAFNHGFKTQEYLNEVPWDRVGQIHIAGHVERNGIRIDTHAAPVSREVWTIYAEALRCLGRPVSSMLERDDQFPEWSEILAELGEIRRIRDEAFPTRVLNALTSKGVRDDSTQPKSVATKL